MLSEKLHRQIYIFVLILIAVFLPLSKYLLSVSQFLLATNWLLEGQFVNKYHKIKKNTPALLVMLLFIIHILWLFNSQNYDYAMHDIKIKVPLFVLPFLLGSSPTLQFKELKTILLFFTGAVLIATFFSIIKLYTLEQEHINYDIRKISVFISHIRFSLMINLAIFSLLYLHNGFSQLWIKILNISTVLWFIIFLLILNSYTGIIIFTTGFIFSLLFYKLFNLKKEQKRILYLFLLALLITLSYNIYTSTKRFYTIDTIYPSHLKEKTLNGNIYTHNTQIKSIENGHYVWINICEKELKNEWKKRSNIPYNQKDAIGQDIKITLISYLSSLNLNKDSLAIWQLSNKDIQMIEQGFDNYIFKNPFSIYTKIYPILKQIYNYQLTNYANGGSITQRFEYIKIAFKIIKEHFVFGTGTGDTEDAFEKHYQKGDSTLQHEYQYRAHNQFITFVISFGIIGGILSLFILIYPFYLYRHSFLASIFGLIILMSMLNEDTLETQAGASFYALFIALLLAGYTKKETE